MGKRGAIERRHSVWGKLLFNSCIWHKAAASFPRVRLHQGGFIHSLSLREVHCLLLSPKRRCFINSGGVTTLLLSTVGFKRLSSLATKYGFWTYHLQFLETLLCQASSQLTSTLKWLKILQFFWYLVVSVWYWSYCLYDCQCNCWCDCLPSIGMTALPILLQNLSGSGFIPFSFPVCAPVFLAPPHVRALLPSRGFSA